MPRLKRVDPSSPGIQRRRRGRGREYLDEDGGRVQDDEILARIAALAVPPAWKDVWICVEPMGHIQATGIDDAGRKQYRYHEKWRERRDAQKFENMIGFARALPAMRRRVARDLDGEGMGRDRVLACAVRLLDIGFFRIGSEEYAEKSESFGLATIRKEHVSVGDGAVTFDYTAKSGKRRLQSVADPAACEIVAAMKQRRGGSPELLAFRDEGGRWRDLRSDDVNAYIKEITGGDFTAKDFRTWNATVLAAVSLARDGQGVASATARPAGGLAGRQGGVVLPREHAGRVPRLLHRPAGDRPLRRRPDHRRAARRAGRAGRGGDPERGRAGRARGPRRPRPARGRRGLARHRGDRRRDPGSRRPRFQQTSIACLAGDRSVETP
jgi:DNA topoisomerase-1